MRSGAGAFWGTAAIWLVVFLCIVLVAKNFGEIGGTSDLLSYDVDTGRVCFLGEQFDAPKKVVDTFLRVTVELGNYYRGYLPFLK